MKRAIITHLIGLSMIALLTVQSAAADVAAEMKAAEGFYKARQYAQAEQVYLKIVQEANSAVTTEVEAAFKARRRLPAVYLAVNQTSQARAAVVQLLADYAHHPRLPHALHEILDQAKLLNKTSEAGWIYQSLLTAQPGQPQAIWLKMGLAIANVHLGDDKAVDAALQNIASQHGTDERVAEAFGQVAWAYRDAKKYESAISLYQYVVDHWPSQEQALFSQRNTVLSYLALGDEANAQAATQKLLTKFAEHKDIAEAVYTAANECRNTKKYRQACDLYRCVVDKYPASERALLSQRFLIVSTAALGDEEATKAAIDGLLTKFPRDLRLLDQVTQAAEGLRRMPKQDHACRLWRGIVENWPKTDQAASAQMWLAETQIASLIEAGNESATQEAIEALIKQSKANPYLSRTLAHVGGKYEDAKQLPNAEAIFRKVIALGSDPERAADIQGAIGWTYFARGLYDDAIREYAKVAQFYPKSKWASDGQYWVAQCYLQKKDLDQARKEYAKTIEMYPDSKEAGYARRQIALIEDRERAEDVRALWKTHLSTVGGVPGCGPSALVTIGRLLGVDLDETEIGSLANADAQGVTTMFDLAQAARAKGLKATGMKLALEDLRKLGKPVIVFIQGNHFTVVKEINDKGVVQPFQGADFQANRLI